MTLFPDRPARPRIAVFSRFAFPVAEERALYGQFDDLALALGAECLVCHSVVSDPRSVGGDLRARLGTGLFVPQLADMHENDVAHFRQTLPEACASLVARLAPFSPHGASGVLARPEVQEAFSFARWVRGAGADLVVSVGLAEGSLQAFVAAHLLALPRVVVLADAAVASEYGQLLPLHAAQAQVVVVAGPRVRDDLAARCGEAVLAKVVVAPDGDLRAPAVRTALGRALVLPRAADAPARGPAAAFVTRPDAPAQPAAVRPFLVLGAERTGSNMLVAMLEVRRGIACAGELFNPRSIAAGDLTWLPHTAVAADLLALRRADPAALLTRLLRAGAEAGASLVGWKLLYGHGLVDDRIVDTLVADRELAVVHLLRADRLQRWLSLFRARQSDEWFAAAGTAPTSRDEPVVLAPQATATEFALGELLEQRFRAVFRGHRTIEFDYEDLAQRLPECGRRLGAFVGVDLGELVPRSRKTGPRDAAAAIANRDELRAAFAGTRWADQFA